MATALGPLPIGVPMPLTFAAIAMPTSKARRNESDDRSSTDFKAASISAIAAMFDIHSERPAVTSIDNNSNRVALPCDHRSALPTIT